MFLWCATLQPFLFVPKLYPGTKVTVGYYAAYSRSLALLCNHYCLRAAHCDESK